ncbi:MULTISPECIES: TonB-dependent receptor [unclassified Parabacteroides]|nr:MULTISPECIES: TonB-dependent receptor [unclassified Parabacteroides]
MKLTLLCVLLGTNLMWAGLTYAQHTSLELNLNNAKLEEVFDVIRRQSEFEFFYSNDLVNTSTKVSVQLKDADIIEVLNEVLPTMYEYRIDDRYVLITRKKEQKVPEIPNALPQQTKLQIKGTVTDANGEAVIGANVVEKGTTNGIITDLDGHFVLSVSENATLEISYIGYIAQSIPVRNQTTFSVILREDSQALNEVVVVGYGTMQKKQVTSSITSLTASDLPVGVGGSSIATALQGKVGGLVMSGTTSPNSGNTFQLRGMASINTSKEPLIVIDGMPGGDIRTIAPEEIQSIDVLKDASAGAIYGTRATGGVILITTKQAKAGKLKLSYTGEVLFKQSFGKPDLLNAADYIATYEGAKNDEGHNTDWWDEAMKDNPTSHRHTITLQGGMETARIFASVMYDENKGIVRGDDRQDYAGRINADFKLLDGWLDISTHVNYRQAKRNQNKPSIEGIMRANPTQAVYDPDSQTGWNIWTTGDNTEMNEIGEAALKTDEGLDKWFRPDVSLKLNILPIKGLSYSQTLAYENRQWEKHFYRSMFSREELRAGRKGWAELEFSKTELINSDGYLSYLNDFGPHMINAVAGYSYFERNNEDFKAKNGNFTNDLIKFWNLGEGSRLKEGEAEMSSSKGITQRLAAYFGRISYSYDDKYMATASIRREGSSKFAQKNRWGTFWSLSGGWRLSREHFMEDMLWINDLKLRVAYGVTGNEGFSADYAARMYGSDTRWLLPDGTWAYSYGVTKNVNDRLGWEEKHEWNLGLDFSVLDNRLYGKFDWYRRKIDGLIYNVEVPQPPNTESSMYQNIGTMKNQGWEIELGADIVRSGTWRYSTSLNLSSNKTTIGSLWGDQTYIDGEGVNNWVQYAHRIEEGVEVGSFFLYRYAGVSDDGKIQIYDKDNNVINSDDGKVDDRVYQKSYIPKLMLGWTHNVGYKNWDLSATFTSWIDYDIYNGIELEYGLRNVVQGNMLYDAIGKNAKITGRPAPCDYFLQDGTFLKLQNITLTYTLPMRKYTSLIDNIKLYFTGHNMFTLTKYEGLNPEVDITGWDAGIEKKSSIYPQTRTYTLGLQLNF